MIVLVIVVLALAVMAYVSYPLWTSQTRESTAAASGSRSRSKARFEPAPVSRPSPVTDADELELDRQIGRLDEQEYAVLRGAQSVPKPASGVEREPNEDDDIERRVHALRQERARRRSQLKDKDQEL
jgi:hypothetical protein